MQLEVMRGKCKNNSTSSSPPTSRHVVGLPHGLQQDGCSSSSKSGVRAVSQRSTSHHYSNSSAYSRPPVCVYVCEPPPVEVERAGHFWQVSAFLSYLSIFALIRQVLVFIVACKPFAFLCVLSLVSRFLVRLLTSSFFFFFFLHDQFYLILERWFWTALWFGLCLSVLASIHSIYGMLGA